MPTFRNNLARADVLLGILSINRVSDAVYAPQLTELLESVSINGGNFSHIPSERRKAVRDILRNGRYKPAGRGKPASEFLQRMLDEEKGLPRIAPLVDIFNYLSARTTIPISVWNVGACPSHSFVFELGREDDIYRFNQAGHEIRLRDLVTGFCVDSSKMVPVVSPVKDAHMVKVGDGTDRVAAAFYIPQSEKDVYPAMLDEATRLIHMACETPQIDAGIIGYQEELSFAD